MPGWNEASVDELLADPIVRDLMTADGVDPAELRTLLYRVQRTIECYATRRGGTSSLAGFAQLSRATSKTDRTRPGHPANRGRSNAAQTIALTDHSHLAAAPAGWLFCDESRARPRAERS